MSMSKPKVGVWLIGAWGNVGTTVAVGLASLKKKLTPTTGLVTSTPLFEGIELCDWQDLVIGGHEIRRTSYYETARALWDNSRMFTPDLLDLIEEELETYDANVRPGSLVNVGSAIELLASEKPAVHETSLDAIERLSADLIGFRDTLKLDHVVVVNLASTEPACKLPPDHPAMHDWATLEHALNEDPGLTLPSSSVYATAALNAGCTYLNFTPSVGSNLPALHELAQKRHVLHGGRDGKTGETLLKSVLAPMFAARNLQVQSWVGHNILGNDDGVILNDPINKATKVESKDHLLGEILGYKPQTLVSIEYIKSLGDWKTAWDHIHFDGFLGTRMTMQLTWQGCDSALAAPLVLDLVRLAIREKKNGSCGVMAFLSSFFKSPLGNAPMDFFSQYRALENWAAQQK